MKTGTRKEWLAARLELPEHRLERRQQDRVVDGRFSDQRHELRDEPRSQAPVENNPVATTSEDPCACAGSLDDNDVLLMGRRQPWVDVPDFHEAPEVISVQMNRR